MSKLLYGLGLNKKQVELYDSLSRLRALRGLQVVLGGYRPRIYATITPGVSTEHFLDSRLLLEAKVVPSRYSVDAMNDYLLKRDLEGFEINDSYMDNQASYCRAILFDWDCGTSRLRVNGENSSVRHEVVLAVKKKK